MLIIIHSAVVDATTLARLSLADIVNNAETIFIGSCISLTTEKQAEGIYSRMRFRVSEVLKGAPAQEQEVVLPGGSFNGRTEQILGMPHFSPNEEVILFLGPPNAQGHAWPIGLGQGKYRIIRNKHTATASVHQSLEDISLRPLNGTAKITSPSNATIPLDSFLTRVKTHIKPQRKIRDDLY